MNIKLIVLTAATICGLAAQDSSRRLKVSVPFGFEANGVKMEAGTYFVTAAEGQPMVTVFNKATGRSIMLMSGSASDNRERSNSLEFKRYNGVYFLSAMQIASTGQKLALPYSRREKEMAIAIQPEVIIARAE